MRARILFQAQEVTVYLPADVRIEPAEISLCGRSNFNAPGQDSVSKFPHEVAERNCSSLLRFFQGRARVFEVDSVHLLPGKALQKAEVFDGDDGSQVFPTTGYDGPLLPESGAVDYIGELLPCFRDIETCHGAYESYKTYESMTSMGDERHIAQICQPRRHAGG